LASKQAIIASPPATCAMTNTLPDVVVGQKERLAGFLGGPRGAVESTELLDLVHVVGVLLALGDAVPST
jgi:hypothetical protein